MSLLFRLNLTLTHILGCVLLKYLLFYFIGQDYSSQNTGYLNPYGSSYSSAFRTYPMNSGLYSMKNDLEPYSYDPLDSFYGSAIGSYPPNVTQPSFPTNNVHSQPGSAFNVVQSNSNFPSNQSTFQSSGK